jgi:hypothetical protein
MIIEGIIPILEIDGSVAVVGSSGRLNNHKYGTEIDAHSIVIRFNVAITDDWEDHAGSRTDIRVCNTNVFGCGGNRKPKITKTRYGQDRFFIRKVKNTKIIVCARDEPEKLLENVHQKYSIDPSNEVYAIDVFKWKPPELSKPATVGLTILQALINSNACPTAYGFDFDDRVRDHYWHYRDPAAPCHDVEEEKLLLTKWRAYGKITLKD